LLVYARMSATLRALSLTGLFAVSVSLASTGCLIVADDDNVLTIDNNSDFTLVEIYVAEDGDRSWGPNLAPAGGLQPDELLEVELDCGVYDLRVVDDTDLVCEEFGLDLCLNDEDVFVFRNNTCDVFEAALKKRLQEQANKSGQELAPAPQL
jgi:hypothetical protein